MSTLNSQIQESNSQICCQSISSSTSDDEDEEFLDEDDSNDRVNESTEKTPNNRKKTKKTLGRVKIKMAYIDNKIRRYTTFSKRKTGIMKKAYELATLTGTEVMLLVASETGHVYTYATAKLQPMITSETGKALIQTCLAKDEPIVETIPEIPVTTLNNNDVICIDDNQRKRRTNPSLDPHSNEFSPVKRQKLKCADDIPKVKSIETSSSSSTSNVFSSQSSTVPLSIPCFLPNDSQISNPSVPSYTIDLNTLKANGMNIIFAPTTTTNPSESSTSSSLSTSSPSNIPLVLTLANLPYQPS